MSITPFGGGSKGYLIVVKENKLEVSENQLKIINHQLFLGKKQKSEYIVLTNSEVSLIKRMIQSIVKKKNILNDTAIPDDTWVIKLKLNGRLLIKIDSSKLFTLSSNTAEKKIIDYLIKLSPIQIKMIGKS